MQLDLVRYESRTESVGSNEKLNGSEKPMNIVKIIDFTETDVEDDSDELLVREVSYQS